MKIRLREWRDKRSHSVRELAELAGVSYVTIVKVENGQTSPTVAWLEKVARALAIPVRELFPEEPRPKSRRRRSR